MTTHGTPDMNLGTLGVAFTDWSGGISYGTFNMSVAELMRHLEGEQYQDCAAIEIYVEGFDDLLFIWNAGQWQAFFHRIGQ